MPRALAIFLKLRPAWRSSKMRATVSTVSGGRKKPRRLDTRPGRLSVARFAGSGAVRIPVKSITRSDAKPIGD